MGYIVSLVKKPIDRIHTCMQHPSSFPPYLSLSLFLSVWPPPFATTLSKSIFKHMHRQRNTPLLTDLMIHDRLYKEGKLTPMACHGTSSTLPRERRLYRRVVEECIVAE